MAQPCAIINAIAGCPRLGRCDMKQPAPGWVCDPSRCPDIALERSRMPASSSTVACLAARAAAFRLNQRRACSSETEGMSAFEVDVQIKLRIKLCH